MATATTTECLLLLILTLPFVHLNFTNGKIFKNQIGRRIL